jgi:hypothetical protein
MLHLGMHAGTTGDILLHTSRDGLTDRTSCLQILAQPNIVSPDGTRLPCGCWKHGEGGHERIAKGAQADSGRLTKAGNARGCLFDYSTDGRRLSRLPRHVGVVPGLHNQKGLANCQVNAGPSPLTNCRPRCHHPSCSRRMGFRLAPAGSAIATWHRSRFHALPSRRGSARQIPASPATVLDNPRQPADRAGSGYPPRARSAS